MASNGPASRNRGSLPNSRNLTSSTKRLANSDDQVESPDRGPLSSGWLDERPNNWDFSSWRPNSNYDNTGTRPMKKANDAKEQNTGGTEWDRHREREPDRDRGQENHGAVQRTGSWFSERYMPEEGRGNRKHTPSSAPRTKGPALLPSQRKALENLRQHLSYSDNEEAVMDTGEWNNERYVSMGRRERSGHVALHEMEKNEVRDGSIKSLENYVDNTAACNAFASREEGPDSNQIVGRLMQIRDYIKQASSMMDKLKKSPDPDDRKKAGQLELVLNHLHVQEKDCLIQILKSRAQVDKMSSLVGHLKEQEKGYLHLLQKILADREEDLLLRQNSTAEPTGSRQGSDSEDTTELDVVYNSSDEDNNEDEEEEENLPEENEAPLVNGINNARPIIEDRLGRHGDTDNDDALNSARSSNPSNEEPILVPPADRMWEDEEDPLPAINELLFKRAELQSFLENKNDELSALRQQHELLKQMLHQQEQLKALHGRHAALTALQHEAEQQMASEAALNNEGAASAGEKSDKRDDESASVDLSSFMKDMPQEITELRRRLDYLKNLDDLRSDQHPDLPSRSSSKPPPPRPPARSLPREAPPTELDQLSMVSSEQRQLQDKLQQLQQKKHQMDSLLQELHALRQDRLNVLNNELENASQTSSMGHMTDGAIAAAAADSTAAEAQEMLAVLEARDKLKKLQDVKTRLNELKDLVQYYQTGNQFIHGAEQGPGVTGGDLAEDSAALVLQNDFEDSLRSKNIRDLSKDVLRRQSNQRGGAHVDPDPSDTSETGSQGSSSSTKDWNDDPQVQEKVRRLKEAKEKLRRLQELVAMVQQSPDLAQVLPNDLADLAASVDDGSSDFSSRQGVAPPRSSPAAAVAAVSRANNVAESNSPGTAADLKLSFREREQLYESKMEEQQAELSALMAQRDRLLQQQAELQRLHDSLPSPSSLGRQSELLAEASGPSKGRPQVDKSNKERDQAGNRQDAVRHRSAPQDVAQQVTFQDPLETVVSNEELFDRMRQQRILREELRERKKELEQFMRKGDRPRRHYGRNQDNQSDNISYSNKSYQDGASASEDVTMATWGGSTAGNLESIEEGEGGSAAQRMEEEDDAYPSDGVVQVEEEEEANGESDRDTYTIEDDDYSAAARRQQVEPPIVEAGEEGRRGQARRRGAPFQRSAYAYNYWASDNQVLNNRSKRRRRRKVLSAEDNPILYKMQQEIASLRSQMEAFTTQQASPAASSEGLQHQCSQLQQQQLLIGLNHCYYQLLHQHHQLIDRFGQLEAYLTQQDAGFHGSAARSPRPRAFEVDPQFPESFAFLNDPSASAALSNYAEDNRLLTTAKPGGHLSTGPPYLPQDLSGADRYCFLPRKIAPKRSKDRRESGCDGNIPIDTIQARDAAAKDDLRINLEEATNRSKPKKRSPKINTPSKRISQDVVIGRRFPTPSRAGAAAQLASQQVPGTGRSYRPGLSAGISGTAYEDNNSMSSMVSSALSSCPGGEDPYAERAIKTDRSKAYVVDGDSEEAQPECSGELTVFESLRETIYSEVATLISQNENRPHFLIELFRELQLLSSDYLRQRALYAIQDLVTHYLTDEKANETQAETTTNSMGWTSSTKQQSVGTNTVHKNITESTPSESLISSEDEGAKPNPFSNASSLKKAPEDQENLSIASANRFDYAENVDTSSSMSTPTSGQAGSGWVETPFAQDSLGDTVIHLDQALRKMRDYERKLAEAGNTDPHGASPISKNRPNNPSNAAEASNTPADNASDGSMSDVPYPRIDTQQLDMQIKTVMTEIIPVLKDHMDEVCSPQLLQYVRRLVLSLTERPDQGQEFARFFRNQLGSILQDSLAKFEGRKMRECGEDMLVEMSEILFNELAFFRLMQDLDDPKAKVKARLKQWREDSCTSHTSTETAVTQEEPEFPVAMATNDTEEEQEDDVSSLTSESSPVSSESDEDNEEEDQNKKEDTETLGEEDDEEEENLGKERDDEFAMEASVREAKTEHKVPSPSNVNIMLAPSETKPFTRIGSDEDDEGEDEVASNGDPSETAVSRDAEKEKSAESAEDDPQKPCIGSKEGGASSAEAGPSEEAAPKEESTTEAEAQEVVCGASGEGEEKEAEEASSPVNGCVEEDEGELSPSDLPAKLNVLSKEDLAEQMEAEQQALATMADNALQSIEQDGAELLAGDPMALKEPDSSDPFDGHLVEISTSEGQRLVFAEMPSTSDA